MLTLDGVEGPGDDHSKPLPCIHNSSQRTKDLHRCIIHSVIQTITVNLINMSSVRISPTAEVASEHM